MELEPGWLVRLGAPGTLLSLMLLGHALADFVFQTDGMLVRKKTRRGLAVHGAWVAVIQTATVAPYLSPATVPVILGVAAAHLLVDLAKVRAQPNSRWKATWFLMDQALHVAIVVVAWYAIVSHGWWADRAFGVDPMLLSRIAFLVAAYAFVWNGGSALVRDLLLSRGDADVATPNRMGKLIGCLERWIVLTLVLLSQWTAIGFVFAAKSIARFKQIEERAFAEYYLVGTLASLVIAVAAGLACKWALGV